MEAMNDDVGVSGAKIKAQYSTPTVSVEIKEGKKATASIWFLNRSKLNFPKSPYLDSNSQKFYGSSREKTKNEFPPLPLMGKDFTGESFETTRLTSVWFTLPPAQRTNEAVNTFVLDFSQNRVNLLKTLPLYFRGTVKIQICYYNNLFNYEIKNNDVASEN